jgi:alpha-L-fucosidase
MVLFAALFFVLSSIGPVRGEESQPESTPPKRPADFKPFQCEYTAEQLKEKFSDAQMTRAAVELQEIQAVNEKGPWKADWASLGKHPVPEWFQDAKFGIAVNWGLYSVPAWDLRKEPGHAAASRMYPDAYPTWMYDLPSHREHHAKTWGKGFEYDDFFPLFTAENYDPEKLAALLHDVGARYVLPFCKHHDGVAWWDSQWTRRNFVRMGPKKDLLTPLVQEARKRNIKVGLYCPLEEYAQAALDADGHILARIWPFNNTRLVPLSDANRRRISGCIPVKDYFKQYMVPLLKEMIDRFDPDVMWLDGGWSDPVEVTRGREIAAYLYNRSLGRKEVCINDRLGIGTQESGRYGDFATSESHTFQSFSKYWEEIRSISPSYAYNYEDTEATVLSREGLVRMLVDIVSRNGNLLLILGPDRTGKIPDLQLDRVKALGRWLKVNGEAIYATRLLPPYAEGDVRYTRSKDGKSRYTICTKWPGKALRLAGVRAQTGAEITMLGVEKPLAWTQDDKRLEIVIPQQLQDCLNRPCEHAWAIKISAIARSAVSSAP